MQKFRNLHADANEETPCHGLRCCDREGCTAAGEYRAPKSRTRLNDYFWFCLDHVREYNKAWDYYAGMSEQEIEAALRQDITWQRPSWPMGEWRTLERQMRDHVMNDYYHGTGQGSGADRGDGHGGDPAGARRRAAARSPEAEALDLMDLAIDADVVQIKARYRELVKIHHPDANGGDKDAEERLKRINQAYTTLKASFGI